MTKPHHWGLALLGVAATGACGSEVLVVGGGEESAGGAGGTTPVGATSSGAPTSSPVSVTSSTGSGGSGGICNSGVQFDGDVYDGCLDQYCCSSFDPCWADADCTSCINNGVGSPGCSDNQLYSAFLSCFDDTCAATVCATTLGYQSPALNTCVSHHCCSTFDPCAADPACAACLADPQQVGCDNNQLFQSYRACREAKCPQSVCGSGVVYAVDYSNGSTDANYPRMRCAQDNCCAQLHACADPSTDGYMPPSDPELDACLLCLSGDSMCVSGPVQSAANAYTACLMQACP